MYKNILNSIFFTIITLIISGCTGKESNLQEEVIPVEISTVKKESIIRKLELVGTLVAWKEANLGAQTTARINKLYVEEGMEVKEGDLLFEMDDTQLEQSKIQYELAKNDYERMKPLYEMGSISRSDFDKIKAGYENAEKVYKMMLANIQFRAPFSGVVTAKRLNEGEIFILSPMGGAPSIVQLMQLNPLKLIVNASESNFGSVKIGQKVDIISDIYPNRVFYGKVNRINQVINPITRTFEVEIKIPNPEKELRPGMFVKATIYLDEVSTIVVDRSAILKQLGVNAFYAFVAQDNFARRREIKLGQEFDEKIEILDGLNVGDKLITKGHVKVKDGSKIEIKNLGEIK